MTDNPRVSVVMAVYNGSKYLREAVQSILAQSFSDFEFIIVDDGSTDDTVEIVQSFKDNRIRLVDAPHEGLPASLNRGLLASRGALVARMDADDVALPDRLAVQVSYLDSHLNIGVLCSDATIIDEGGAVLKSYRMKRLNRNDLRASLLYHKGGKPIIHPSVMMRREVWAAIGGYRKFDCAEDHDFWLRACDRFDFAHIDRPLLRYRVHPGGISRAKRGIQAVSGVMSAICHQVALDTKIDPFTEERALFDQASAEVKEQLECEILPAEAAFREARVMLRTRGIVASISPIARMIRCHGLLIIPAMRRRRVLKMTQRYAVEFRAKLTKSSVVGQQWPKSATMGVKP